jgi:hypothetical protein
MKTIIISDLHNRVDWVEPTLSLLEYDNVVFLGDYFDDFNDMHKDAENAAKWLKQSLNKPNRIHLIGTHDLWYMFPWNSYIKASGNSSGKSKAINKILTKDDWSKLKLFNFEQNHLLTHAGLHPFINLEYDNTKIKVSKDIQRFIDLVEFSTNYALNRVSCGNGDRWLSASTARGGDQLYGGIIWLDWDDEFMPIANMNQIVGHTTHNVPQEMHTKNSKNYCLDTKNKHIGILENCKFLWTETKSIQNI